jgi:hypothetical protein
MLFALSSEEQVGQYASELNIHRRESRRSIQHSHASRTGSMWTRMHHAFRNTSETYGSRPLTGVLLYQLHACLGGLAGASKS